MKSSYIGTAASLMITIASVYITWHIGVNDSTIEYKSSSKTQTNTVQQLPASKTNQVVVEENKEAEPSQNNTSEEVVPPTIPAKPTNPTIVKPNTQKVSPPKPANTQIENIPSTIVVQPPTASRNEPISLPAIPTIRAQLNSRASLTQDQQRVYDLVDAVLKNQTIGMIQIQNCNMTMLQVSFSAVKNDHPEYFWVSNSFLYSIRPNNSMYFGIQYTDSTGKVYGGYLYDATQVGTLNERVGQVLQTALAQVNEGMTPYQKELALHDWLASYVTYRDAAVVNPNENQDAFTVYGALINRSAVCEGYAKAFQLLMYAVNIPCTVTIGFSLSQGPHMWNQVQLNGAWYGVDVTWDDTNSGDILHSYFNISDAQMSIDHIIGKEANDPSIVNAFASTNALYFNTGRPICSSMNENYAVVNGTFINSSSEWHNVITTQVVNAANTGKRSIEFLISAQFSYVYNFSQTINDVTPSLTAANKSISAQYRIISFSILGPTGGKGFIIIW